MRSALTFQGGLIAAMFMISTNAGAQTSYSTEAGKNPNAASKPTPRASDGHPDLTGVWHHFFGIGVVRKAGDNFVVGPLGPPDPDPPADYKPQYIAKVKSLSENQVKEDSTLHCRPPGVPRLGPPQEIVQTPQRIVFLYADSTGNQWRVIPLDGRPHSTDPEAEETYNGDSVGHWEGDTVVVDVTRLTDETWLGDNGLFHTNKLHVIERLRRAGDTIQYQMTADDPEVLQKPWVLKRTLTLQKDALEPAAPCVDRDAGHYVNGEHHENAR
ncbi:MAG TPA: hypothetical protein VIY49_28090 [Bryobacteraceae bacterium]